MNILIYEDWLKPAKFMNEEERAEYYYLVLRHRVSGDVRPEDAHHPIVASNLIGVLKQIDRANETRDQKSTLGAMGGRPQKSSDIEIWTWAQTHPKGTSKQAAEALGVSKSTIDHSEGWRCRKDEKQLSG